MLSWDDYDQDGLAGGSAATPRDAAATRSFLEGLEVAVPQDRPPEPVPPPSSAEPPVASLAAVSEVTPVASPPLPPIPPGRLRWSIRCLGRACDLWCPQSGRTSAGKWRQADMFPQALPQQPL